MTQYVVQDIRVGSESGLPLDTTFTAWTTDSGLIDDARLRLVGDKQKIPSLYQYASGTVTAEIDSINAELAETESAENASPDKPAELSYILPRFGVDFELAPDESSITANFRCIHGWREGRKLYPAELTRILNQAFASSGIITERFVTHIAHRSTMMLMSREIGNFLRRAAEAEEIFKATPHPDNSEFLEDAITDVKALKYDEVDRIHATIDVGKNGFLAKKHSIELLEIEVPDSLPSDLAPISPEELKIIDFWIPRMWDAIESAYNFGHSRGYL